MKLRWHLIGLALATALPILLFSAILVVQLSRQEHAALERGLRETTRALALAVDRELRTTISALEALATSQDLRSPRLDGFVDEAESVLRGQPLWYTILLLAPSGQQVMNLAAPHGAPLPSSPDRPLFPEIIRTGRPAISDLLTVQGIGVDTIIVAVPVLVESRLRYILAAGIRPAAWGALLAEQRVAPEATASILDRQRIIIARSRRAEEFVGHPATPDLAARSREAPEGWGRLITKDGIVTYAAFSRSDLSGWTVVLGTPAAPVDAAMRRSLVAMSAAGVLVLLLAGVAAALLSRRITRPIHATSRSAAALGRGEPVRATVSSPVAEVEAMGKALDAASELLQERGRERDRLLTIEHAARAEAEASLARLERLQAIIDPMLADFGLDDLLPRLLARLRAALRADSASLLLLDESGRNLRLRAADGLAAEQPADFVVPISGGLAGRIAAMGEPLALEDAATEDVVCPALAGAIRSLLGTPLRIGGQVIGVIHLGWAERRRFTDEEVQLLRIVGDRVVLAIRHAGLDDAATHARASAEAANRERDRFFAAVSHELRAPLSAILSWAGVLSTAHGDPPLTARAVAGIRRNVEVLARLSGDLGELARAQTGKLRLQIEPVDLLSVVGDAIDGVRASVDGKGLTLREVYPARRPRVAGDAARLAQVFANLLTNAVKFTSPGGLLTVHVDAREGEAVVRVTDTGRGLRADLLPRVFEPFSQAEGGEHGGLGLGLSIVRHLVRLHGGTVHADSPGEGRGASFTVTLPLLPDGPVQPEDDDEGRWKAEDDRSSAAVRGFLRALVAKLGRDTRLEVADAEGDRYELVLRQSGELDRLLALSRGLVRRAMSAPGILAALGAILTNHLTSPVAPGATGSSEPPACTGDRR